jgi:hypothetical protein
VSSSIENAGVEEAAWAEVLLAWDDEARHRAYLDRFSDLDGLAVAGRRYREVLETRPGDPLAVRFRDEVVKRAMVQGLVALPRTAPPPRARKNLVRAAALAFALGLGAAAWFVARRLGLLLGASP